MSRSATSWVQVKIRKAIDIDIQAISDLALSAFGPSEGPDIVQLIAELSVDVTAKPLLSLVATADDRVVGHVLFSKVRLTPPGQDVSAALLAPLAVHPDFQSQRIGGQLVAEGLQQLSGSGVDLVFVLGHPGYYPRFGFSEAGIRDFEVPYPIPEKKRGGLDGARTSYRRNGEFERADNMCRSPCRPQILARIRHDRCQSFRKGRFETLQCRMFSRLQDERGPNREAQCPKDRNA